MKKMRTYDIIDYVKTRKRASLAELMAKFGVSSATIHRDVSELVASVGDIQTAYCLDGGSSCRILFNGVGMDSPYPNTKSAKSRLSDILYFASAYQE